ncbi:IS66 family transposase [Bradyrhizobium brasilense]|uniref:IS66 family transposase n=1 Tax=Bradyrhizobium brasilense TaxID=1419277 RepID=UPI003D3157A6
MRQTLSRPLVHDLQVYMREQLAKLSWPRPGQGVRLFPEAMDELHVVLQDGRVCLSNNAAERACEALPLNGSPGYSAALIAADGVRPPCTASSSRQR